MKKLLLLVMVLGTMGADDCRDGSLGAYCESTGDCDLGLRCRQVTFLQSSTACVATCPEPTPGASDCWNGEGVCLMIEGPDGNIPTCLAKCRPSGACTWGLPQHYNGACFCAPGVFQ